jgi:hypothetical protein
MAHGVRSHCLREASGIFHVVPDRPHCFHLFLHNVSVIEHESIYKSLGYDADGRHQPSQSKNPIITHIERTLQPIMFLVARPTTYPHTHPYAHPGTVYPHEHVQAPFNLPFDSVHAYEQHVARRRHDELVRQRALAAVARAQQRREYERRLAIQAAEEEIFLQRIARLRAQEKYRRELARQERLRQVEEARRAQRQRLISIMRVAMAQQAVGSHNCSNMILY